MEYVQFTVEQVEAAKQNLLAPAFQDEVDSGALDLLEALQKQAFFNQRAAQAEKEIAAGEHQPLDEHLMAEVKQFARRNHN